MRSTRTLRVPSAGTRASSKSTVASTTCSGSRNPRSTCCSSSRRRRKSPAATSTASDSANWAVMSAPRRRPPPRVPPRVPPPESDARTATRADFSAGASPNTKTVVRPTPARTSSTRASIGVSITIGRGDRGTNEVSAFRAHASTAPPTSTAPAARSRLSVMSCCTMRAGRAPRASRTAISCSRAAPRCSSRLATLEQTMSSTSPLMPSITVKSGAIRSPGADVEHARGQSDVAIVREARRQPGA